MEKARQVVEGVVSDENCVAKANTLIEKSYKLSAREQKLILILASTIKRSDTKFNEVSFKIADIAERMGLTGNKVYEDIKQITKNLATRLIELSYYKDGKIVEEVQMTWLASARYRPRTGTVQVEFSQRLMPYLLELGGQFTMYKLGNVVQLKSSYSIRLYEILKRWESLRGEASYSVKELKNMLGLEPQQYPLYANFKARVIVVAQKELAEKTDIRFEFEELKLEGRAVSHIKFTISQNVPESKRRSQLSLLDFTSKTVDAALVDEMVRYGVSKKKAEELAQEISETEIRANLAYVLDQHQQGRVKNLGAFVYEAIKNNYAKQPDIVEEHEKKKQEEAENKIKEERAKQEDLKLMQQLNAEYEQYKETYLSEVSDDQMENFKKDWLENVAPGNAIMFNMLKKYDFDFDNVAVKSPFRRWLFLQLKADGFLTFESWAKQLHNRTVKLRGEEYVFIS